MTKLTKEAGEKNDHDIAGKKKKKFYIKWGLLSHRERGITQDAYSGKPAVKPAGRSLDCVWRNAEPWAIEIWGGGEENGGRGRPASIAKNSIGENVHQKGRPE